jgi:hypothetical protein
VDLIYSTIVKEAIKIVTDQGPIKKLLVTFRRLGLYACIIVTLALTTGATALAGEGVTYEMEKVVPYEYRGDVRALSQFPLAAPQKQPYVHPVLRPPRTEKILTPLLAPEVPAMNIPLNAPLAPMPAATVNFLGMSFSDSCTGVPCGAGWPPDPNGDVGPNHYIQAVNDAYAIYDKTGTLLARFTEDSLWSGTGSNPCNGNSEGDPIVLHDQLTDRWILTHFAFAFSGGNPVAPFYQCIAVSKTSDPVSGGWWLYPLRMDPGGSGPPSGTLNDYPKFGIWPDCLYMSANEFAMPSGSFLGTSYASLSRSNLESGAALTWSLGFINNTSDPFTMIPSNLLGSAAGSLPPAGTPNYFVSESTKGFNFEVRKFTAGPNCGAGGTLSGPTAVSQASYASIPNNTNIVPQPGTTNTLDMIDDRLMQKVQYRNIGGSESLWVVHNVLTSSTGTVVPQWAQIDVTGGNIAAMPVQQQIYIPDTTLYRWMGSLAVDGNGNMALGYSTSSTAQYPSIAYSGRLATDPLNSLPQTETQLIAGLGSQTLMLGGSPVQRWGDYTAMSVDPADDCTFWYTNQYYDSPANGGSGNWQTRIGSFKFSSCTGLVSEPVVTTAAVTNIKFLTATGGGDVTASGGAPVTARGVCWNITSAPSTTDGSTCTNGTGTGPFTSSITQLNDPGIYYVRAYATNSAGTAYGNQVEVIRPNPPTLLTVK